jgi:hypothetical protein
VAMVAVGAPVPVPLTACWVKVVKVPKGGSWQISNFFLGVRNITFLDGWRMLNSRLLYWSTLVYVFKENVTMRTPFTEYCASFAGNGGIHLCQSRWLNSKTKILIRWHRGLRKKTALF